MAHLRAHTHAMNCAVDTMDSLSSTCPLMGKKPNSGTADAGAAAAWLYAEVAAGLMGREL